MAQVSRNPLARGLQEQMHKLFHKVLAELGTEMEISEFLDDLLTPTEKVMLAKRLAIAFLLDQGYDQRTIHTIMKVSVSTVNSVNFWLKYKGAGYRKVIGRIRKEQSIEDFMSQIDDRLRQMLRKETVMRTLILPNPEHKKRSFRF